MADLAPLLTWDSQLRGILLYLAMIAVNTLLNWLSLPRLGKSPAPQNWPAVAILVPARDEEVNICRCVTSLLAQDYPDFSVWVLDDASTDATPRILAEMAAGMPRLHVGQSAPLLAGWLGKNWACHQLAASVPADVPLLLFVDADTWHAPTMLRQSVAALLAHKADLLSALPQQETRTLAEILTVPLLPWALLSHFPLWLTRRVHWPRLSAAVGQHMLWRRSAYQQVGGHAAVRHEVVEDMALARRAAKRGLRVLLLPGRGQVFCQMYHSTADAIAGFGKNLFSVFERRLLTYIFVWLWLGFVFLGPWLALFWSWTAGATTTFSSALVAIVLTSLIWGMVVRMSGMHPLILPLSPVIVFSSILLALHSLGQTLTRRAEWKGRRIS
jgi:chlorobactene glucosyltransferase